MPGWVSITRGRGSIPGGECPVQIPGTWRNNYGDKRQNYAKTSMVRV